MKWKNRITDLLQIEYPIIQAPMFGVSTVEMAAAASNLGVLGSLALADLPADQCTSAVRKIKSLTDKPFAANLFLNEVPEITPALETKYSETRRLLEDVARTYQLEVNFPDLHDLNITNYHDQVDALIEAQCPVVSFTFGNLDQISIEKFHAKNTILIGTCTSVAEAKVLAESEIDIICFQGIEAGGHRGCFLSDGTEALNGLDELKYLAATLKNPLIYAGGIYRASDLIKTKAMGAEGFQLGSIFLNAAESSLMDFEKDTLDQRKDDSTILTNTFSGRYARGLANNFTALPAHLSKVLPYPYQNKITGPLRKAAKSKQYADLVNLWTGRDILEYSRESVKDIITKLIHDVTQHDITNN